MNDEFDDLGDYDTYGDDCGALDFSDMDELGFRGRDVELPEEDEDEDEDEDVQDTSEIPFADPNGVSALRAASSTNPRNRPCPTCRQPNRLTPADVALHYQCDECADRDERGW